MRVYPCVHMHVHACAGMECVTRTNSESPVAPPGHRKSTPTPPMQARNQMPAPAEFDHIPLPSKTYLHLTRTVQHAVHSSGKAT